MSERVKTKAKGQGACTRGRERGMSRARVLNQIEAEGQGAKRAGVRKHSSKSVRIGLEAARAGDRGRARAREREQSNKSVRVEV
eukprot:2146263-Pleurochrysis_carterae.AAC.2